MVEQQPLDDALFALADPTRRAIVARLAAGEARVTDLAAPFPVSLNAISKHIRVLERGGLVRRARRGREHVLALEPLALDQAAKAIDDLRALWTWRLQKLDTLLKTETKDER
jgi:DNA-binding transcriptional ArsR family regulator